MITTPLKELRRNARRTHNPRHLECDVVWLGDCLQSLGTVVTAFSKSSTLGTLLGQLTLEDEVTAILRNLRNLSTYDRVLHPRSVESSALLSFLLSRVNMYCMARLG
jgi:hypothetical protein